MDVGASAGQRREHPSGAASVSVDRLRRITAGVKCAEGGGLVSALRSRVVFSPVFEVYRPLRLKPQPGQPVAARAGASPTSRSWMRVRHLLTHGITTGWRSDRWPAPLRTAEPAATEALRPMDKGRHSLVAYGRDQLRSRLHPDGAHNWPGVGGRVWSLD